VFPHIKNNVERCRVLTEGYGISVPTHPYEKLSFALPRTLHTLFYQAGYSSQEQRQYLNKFAIGCSLPLLILIVRGAFHLVPLIVLVPTLFYLHVRQRARRRIDLFERDYTALLLSLSSAVKTGLDPLVALAGSADLFAEDSEVRKELLVFADTLNSGETEEAAIQSFARSINHPDITLFRTALILSRREGSSLSHCLQRLARVTRQRQSFRRRTRSAIAMHKLSALGIMVSALIVLGIQFLSNPGALHKTIAHPLGSKVGLMGGLLMICGLVWIALLARRRV
jgi:Flp pilus assembly protein TadB